MTTALFGFGPLERWLHDDDVSEVMVNDGRDVWIERAGTAVPAGPQYVGRLQPGAIDTIIERILGPIGRRLDRSSPVVDARLPDGSRVCAVLPPVAVDGPCLSVRKFARRHLTIGEFGDDEIAGVLRRLVDQRCNVVVSGATSSGKTTLLNALAGTVPANERIITLEDTAELHLPSPHVLRLESRPGTADGLAPVDLAALLRAALRLRPDRIVVGEIRGDEAVELVMALNTGHDGSLATVHANSSVDALARLEALVVRASPGWPLPAVRDQVQRSIDVVVHVARRGDGTRGIDEIVEVVESPDDRRVRPLVGHGRQVAELTRSRR